MKVGSVVVALSVLLAAGASLPARAVAKGTGRMKDAVAADRRPETKRERDATKERKGKLDNKEPSRTKDNWPRFK